MGGRTEADKAPKMIEEDRKSRKKHEILCDIFPLLRARFNNNTQPVTGNWKTARSQVFRGKEICLETEKLWKMVKRSERNWK